MHYKSICWTLGAVFLASGIGILCDHLDMPLWKNIMVSILTTAGMFFISEN